MLDRNTNSDQDLQAVVEHLTEDDLVGWGWAPGTDASGRARDPVPISKVEFSRIVHAWAERGAACPE